MKTTTTAPAVKQTTSMNAKLGRFPEGMSVEQRITVKGHGELKLRPIMIEDEPAMIRFHSSLSEESIYMRYFEYLGLNQRTAHDRLRRICRNTPDSYAAIVETAETISHHETILAVGRLTTTAEQSVVTFDTLMINQTAPSALAKILLKRLIKLAHAFGFNILTGDLLVADHDTSNLCRTLGFSLQTLPEGGLVRVTLDLGIAPALRR